METIQFIAHHDLQAQSFQGILPHLKNHNCIVSIGQDIPIDPRASIVVVADHLAFQSFVKPNSDYKLVHISHDVADLDIYEEEFHFLKNFDLVLCPTLTHYRKCRELFPSVSSWPVGWAKSSPFENKTSTVENWPDKAKTIIFAPTEIADLDWLKFVKIFSNSNYNFLIKNHIYWNFEEGQNPPKGQELRYQRHKSALVEMEKYIKAGQFTNIELVDRKSNISNIFPRASYLLTDSSSAALEFAASGIAIEFGVFDHNLGCRVPEVSKVDNRVIFIPEVELQARLQVASLNQIVNAQINPKLILNEVEFFHQESLSVDSVSAYLILFSQKSNASNLGGLTSNLKIHYKFAQNVSEKIWRSLFKK